MTIFSTRKRACIQYEIKRCSGPCVNHISKEEYKKSVDQAKLFLDGKTLALQEMLSNQMQKYSDNLEYEQAMLTRDKIKSINLIQERSAITNTNIVNFDVIGYAQVENNFCIKFFTYRGGQNYGDKVYFVTSEDEKELLLISFLTQIYKNRKLPDLILVPFEVKHLRTLEELFSKKVKILFDAENVF